MRTKSAGPIVVCALLLCLDAVAAGPPDGKLPVIVSPPAATFVAGKPGSFTVMSTSTPAASIAAVGLLPAGVTFVDGKGRDRGTGVLAGTATPGSGGVYPIRFVATNPHGSATQSFTLTVCNSIAVTPPPVTDAIAGAAFSANFTQSGGVGSTTFAIVSGALPAGLTLSSSGIVAGTPGAIGTFTITVSATDANGCSGSAPWTVSIRPRPATPPTAAADSYEHADVSFSVAAPGLLANDTLNGSALTSYGATGVEATTGLPATTSNGGTVIVAADGGFTYTPPPVSQIATDAFRYVIANASGSATGTVSFSLYPHTCGTNPIQVVIAGPVRSAGPLAFDPYSFTATASSADDDATVCPSRFRQTYSFSWRITGPSTDVAGNGSTFGFTPSSNGPYTVTVQAAGSSPTSTPGSAAQTLDVSCSDPRPQVVAPFITAPGNQFHRDDTVALGTNASSLCRSNPAFTYAWTLQSSAGAVSLNNSTSPAPSFQVNQPSSDYLATVVVSDGLGNQSVPVSSTFRSSSCGANPVSASIIGPERPAGSLPFDPYAFSFSASSNDDDPALCPARFAQKPYSFSWSLSTVPSLPGTSMTPASGGSSTTISPGGNGTYSLQLVATGSQSATGTTSKSFTVDCSGPVASAPVITAVSDPDGFTAPGTFFSGATVTLGTTASSSCISNATLNYAWTLQSSDPSATLINPTSATPSFVVSAPSATYVATVVVSDQSGNKSAPASATFTASSCGANPVSLSVSTSQNAGNLPFDPWTLTVSGSSQDNDPSVCPPRFAQGPYSFAWQVPQGGKTMLTAAGNTATFAAGENGSWPITVVATGAGGISGNKTITLVTSCSDPSPQVTSPSVASITDPFGGVTSSGQFFRDDRITLTSSASAACMSSPVLSYSWTLQSSDAATLSSPSGATPSFVALSAATSYLATVVATDQWGNTSAPGSSTFTSSNCGAHAATVVAASSQSPGAKPMDPWTLSATASSADNDPAQCPARFAHTYAFSWSTSPAAASINPPTAATTTFIPASAAQHLVTVTATDAASQTWSGVTTIDTTCGSPVVGTPSIVKINGVPYGGQPVFKGSDIDLVVAASSDCFSTPALQYQWTVSMNGSPVMVDNTSSTFTFTPAQFDATYEIRVAVSDGSGMTSVSQPLTLVTSACGMSPPSISLSAADQTLTGLLVQLPGESAPLLRDITTTSSGASAPTATVDGQTFDLPFYVDTPVQAAFRFSDAATCAMTVSTTTLVGPVGSTATPGTFLVAVPSSGIFPIVFQPDIGDVTAGSETVPGNYTVSFAVASGPSSFTVTSPAIRVQGRCGVNQPIASFVASAEPVLLTDVVLDASSSTDPDNAPLVVTAGGNSSGCGLSQTLTYFWSVVSAPPGAGEPLSSSYGVQTTFNPQVPGPYVIQLNVADSTGRPSSPVTQTFVVKGASVVQFLQQPTNAYVGIPSGTVIVNVQSSNGTAATGSVELSICGETCTAIETVLLDDAGNAVCNTFTPAQTGTFYFRAKYSGDDVNAPAEAISNAVVVTNADGT